MKKELYFCVGCRQVHYDNCYKASDGDLLIIDWNKFLESVQQIKDVLSEKKGKEVGK